MNQNRKVVPIKSSKTSIHAKTSQTKTSHCIRSHLALSNNIGLIFTVAKIETKTAPSLVPSSWVILSRTDTEFHRLPCVSFPDGDRIPWTQGWVTSKELFFVLFSHLTYMSTYYERDSQGRCLASKILCGSESDPL